MKILIKVIWINLIAVFIFGIYNIVYGTGRFVDIPVPPNNSGYADFSSGEDEKNEKEDKENREKNNDTAEQFIGKSSNNLLKKLEIEGYSFVNEFNSQKNEYVLDLTNNENLTKINVIAEAEDESAKIEGVGTIEIKKNQDIININVIAENGNLNVYTIKIKNNKSVIENQTQSIIEKKENDKSVIENETPSTIEKKENYKYNNIIIKIIIVCLAIVMIVIIVVILVRINKNGKHTR